VWWILRFCRKRKPKRWKSRSAKKLKRITFRSYNTREFHKVVISRWHRREITVPKASLVNTGGVRIGDSFEAHLQCVLYENGTESALAVALVVGRLLIIIFRLISAVGSRHSMRCRWESIRLSWKGRHAAGWARCNVRLSTNGLKTRREYPRWTSGEQWKYCEDICVIIQ